LNPLSNELLTLLNTPTIADVLDGLGIWGVLDSRIHQVNQKKSRFIGRAYTTRWAPVRKPKSIISAQPSTWDDVKNFLAPDVVDAKGIVYVAGVDDGLLFDYALAGGFSATDFEHRGFSGVLLGGAIRDAHVVNKLAVPIWASNYTPADTQGNYRVVESGGQCMVGRVAIRTGDVIMGDESGIVVIPADMVDTVIDAVCGIEKTELLIQARMQAGEKLFDIVASLGRL
jgi:regulator of RNase E activity RraA